jgi:hypothetical protein
MVIKSRLAKGVWRDDKSKLVELYLEVKASVREKAAQAEQKDAARAACRRTRGQDDVGRPYGARLCPCQGGLVGRHLLLQPASMHTWPDSKI